MSLLHVLYGFVYITVLFLIIGTLGYFMVSNLRISTHEFAISAVLFALLMMSLFIVLTARM